MVRINSVVQVGIFSLLGCLAACAKSKPQPVKPADELKSLLDNQPVQDPEADSKGKRIPAPKLVMIPYVRVQIFPHISRYTTPQGLDTVLDRVSFVSDGDCSLEHGPDGRTEFVEAQHVLELNPDSVDASPLILKCEKPATLKRGGEVSSFAYRGYFEIRALPASRTRPAHLQVVNVVSFEDYLKGVVPSEMPASWPTEALKVQAVAARTYSAFEILHARTTNAKRVFDVDDTVQYQAYRGVDLGARSSDEAVEATAGQILLYDRKILKAYFSADSGGTTESAFNAFKEMLAYCLNKLEAYDLSLVSSHWQVKSSLAAISAALKDANKLATADELVGVKVLMRDRFESGRAKIVRLSLRDGRTKTVTGKEFAGVMKLRSNYFNFGGGVERPVADIPDAEPSDAPLEDETPVVIHGWGFGHGVGMNQTGSKVLANLGWDYRQILAFYYTDSEMGELPSSR